MAEEEGRTRIRKGGTGTPGGRAPPFHTNAHVCDDVEARCVMASEAHDTRKKESDGG